MKKLFCLLMTAVMLLTLGVPMASARDVYDSPLKVFELYVGGVDALKTPQGDGWSYNHKTRTLTLEDCTITQNQVVECDWGVKVDSLIYFEGVLTIELKGDNYLEHKITSAPSDYTRYHAICADVFSTAVADPPSELKIIGDGNLTAGVEFPEEAVDWEYLEYSCGIFCNASGGVDLTGLSKGSNLDVYGGMTDVEAPWVAQAWNCSPTFSDESMVIAYRDIEGTIENEFGYNWNNNDAWRMKVITADAYLAPNGMLTILDDGKASGDGWNWENNYLLLEENTAVKAVYFKNTVDKAKLYLAGDVELDSTGMYMDYSDANCITAECPLEIHTNYHKLTLRGDGYGIYGDCADVTVAGGYIDAYNSYTAAKVDGGRLAITNTEFNDFGGNGISTYYGYDEDYNEVSAGNLIIANSSVNTTYRVESYKDLVVIDSEIAISDTNYGLVSQQNMHLTNSTINVEVSDRAIQSYGDMYIDNCNLNLESEGMVIFANYSEGEPNLDTLKFTNMTVTEPEGGAVGAYYNGYDYVTTIVDANGDKATRLVATANLKELFDEETEVSVLTDEDVELSVEPVEDDAVNELLENMDVTDVYDITLTQNGTIVQPDGTVTVRIPCDDQNARVYHWQLDGILHDMNAEYVGGYLVFETNHFSVYVVAAPVAEATGYSLTLTGNIGVNFFMNLSSTALADENAKVVFSYADNTMEVPLGEGEYTNNGYRFTCEVPAKDMSSEITCKVVTSTQESQEFKYSVKEYAEYILANSDTYWNEYDIVRSMLNYGAAAQEYFGYNTDTLANESLSEDDKAVDEIDFYDYAFNITEEDENVTYYGTALSLKSEVAILHYFIIDKSVDVSTLDVLVNGKDAELEKNGNLYVLKITDIPAQDIYDAYEVNVGDVTLEYSVASYGYMAQWLEKTEIIKLMNSLGTYSQYAQWYIEW
ncbi:MAG: hypothetical protein E7566_02475 [Ruminococcaceae bacterium]|nr:hypothetical protein [Oscillospiraceae bacterium]